MVERSVQILNKNGLHARPAAEIVKVSAKFQSEVTLVLRAEGADANEALDALAALILNKFGER